MKAQGFLSYLLGAASFLTLGFPAIGQAEPWYAYCYVEKDHRHVCQPPVLMEEDFNRKCQDLARELEGQRWGSRRSTSMSSLEADMGEHCDEIYQAQGQLYTCNLAVQCPETSSERSALQSLGNRIYASSPEVAVERCNQLNEHRLLAAVNRFSKADCFLKLVPQANSAE